MNEHLRLKTPMVTQYSKDALTESELSSYILHLVVFRFYASTEEAHPIYEYLYWSLLKGHFI